MCGFVDAALSRGWDVVYVGLIPTTSAPDGDISFHPHSRTGTLEKRELLYSPRKRSFIKRFIGRFDVSAVTEILGLESLGWRIPFDGVIAFDSLAIAAVRSIPSRCTVAILGDPASERLWYSTTYFNVTLKAKALALRAIERRYFRKILPKSWHVAMFGSRHAEEWSSSLGRRVIDLRPFIPSTATTKKVPVNRIVVVFGGTLVGTASRQSIKRVFGDILPALKRALTNQLFELRLVGSCPEDVRVLAQRYPEITIAGRVDSFEDELSGAHIFLLPGSYPVGVRTRICSALAAGNVCVVHPNIFRNMPELVDCASVYAVKRPRDFRSVIQDLVGNPRWPWFRVAAQQFFIKHYSSKIAAKSILSIIEGSSDV